MVEKIISKTKNTIANNVLVVTLPKISAMIGNSIEKTLYAFDLYSHEYGNK